MENSHTSLLLSNRIQAGKDIFCHLAFIGVCRMKYLGSIIVTTVVVTQLEACLPPPTPPPLPPAPCPLDGKTCVDVRLTNVLHKKIVSNPRPLNCSKISHI